jgi:amino acid transporter
MDIIESVATSYPNSILSMNAIIGIIIGSCVIGVIWAYINYLGVKKVQVGDNYSGIYESVVNEPGSK